MDDRHESIRPAPAAEIVQRKEKVMKEYVVGLLFGPSYRTVLLVKKAEGQMHAGLWNGCGGLVEPGESPGEAMAREGMEECGLALQFVEWEEFAVVQAASDVRLHFFTAVSRAFKIGGGSEECKLVELPLDYLPIVHDLDMMVAIAKWHLTEEKQFSVWLDRTENKYESANCSRCGVTYELGHMHLCSASHSVKAAWTTGPEVDMVNEPPHYKTASGLQAIDVIEAFDLGYHLGNTFKYIARQGKKGNALEDLKKAKWYLKRKIENLEKQIRH